MKSLELKPYLTTLDLPFGSGEITKPKAHVVVAADLNTQLFNKYATIEEYFRFINRNTQRLYCSKTWWEDGLQSHIARTVHLLTDDLKSGIFAGFCIQNSPDHFMLLGKLADNSFTEEIKIAFIEFSSLIGVQK